MSVRTGETSAGIGYPAGVAMVMAAGVCLSLGGLMLRHVEEADIWLVLFYRSISFFLTLLVFLTLRYRGRLREPFLAIGRGGLLVSFLLGCGSILYLLAVSLTTVANVVFIISASPLVTAVLGLVVLGERVAPVTWLAMGAALLGIGVMMADGISAGRLDGNLVALGAVLAFAGMVITIRRARAVDMVPASCLGGLVAASLAYFMTGGMAISGHDLMLAVLLGCVQLGGGFLLITIGTRAVPAAEVPLLALTEVVLAPIWVWLWVEEVPSPGTLLGGAILLTAVVGSATVRLRQARSGTL